MTDLVPFDYAQIDQSAAAAVRASARRLHDLERRTVTATIEIGRELLAVKELLGHGHFLPWLHAEFGWSDRTARNFMNVALQFGDKSETVSDLGAKVLYLLAAPSTPDDVRTAVVQRAEQGEPITTETVRVAIAKVNASAGPDQQEDAPPQKARAPRGTYKAIEEIAASMHKPTKASEPVTVRLPGEPLSDLPHDVVDRVTGEVVASYPGVVDEPSIDADPGEQVEQDDADDIEYGGIQFMEAASALVGIKDLHTLEDIDGVVYLFTKASYAPWYPELREHLPAIVAMLHCIVREVDQRLAEEDMAA